MALKETSKTMESLLEVIQADLKKSMKGNRAASQRVRTNSIKLEKVAKIYRKESVKTEKSEGTKKKVTVKKKAVPKKKLAVKKKVVPKKKSVIRKEVVATRKSDTRKKTSIKKVAPKKKATAKLPKKRKR